MGSGHGAHPHEHGGHLSVASLSADRERRLRLVLVLNVAIVAVQVVAGFVAHSVGLLSDAGHNLSDVAAVILSLVAVRLARRPATPSRSYGWHRSTILAAQANAAALLVVTAVIVFEAVRRLLDPIPVHGGIVLVIALVALLVNGGSALLLRDGSNDLNMRSALVHMAGDALASGVIALTGLLYAIFYVLTALAAIAYYRRRIFSNVLDSMILGILPLAAAAWLCWVLVKSLQAAPSAQVWSLIAVVGVGVVLMIAARLFLRSPFFKMRRQSENS